TTAVVTDADRAQVTVHDVVAVAGAVHPLVHRVGRGRVAGGDVLPPGAHGPAHLLDAQGRRLAAAGGRTARRPRLAGVTGGALTVVRARVRGLVPRAVGEVVTLRHVHAVEPRGAAQVRVHAQRLHGWPGLSATVGARRAVLVHQGEDLVLAGAPVVGPVRDVGTGRPVRDLVAARPVRAPARLGSSVPVHVAAAHPGSATTLRDAPAALRGSTSGRATGAQPPADHSAPPQPRPPRRAVASASSFP